MMILQSKITAEALSKINKKYSIYLANSLGMYNWKEITQLHKNPDISVSEYFSRSIGRRLEGDRYVYYAIEKIAKYELLIISKPLIFQANTSGLDSLFERVFKCISLQKSFYSYVKSLPCPCHPNGGASSLKDRVLGTK